MSTDLNNGNIVLWFDDLGTGNEQYNFLSNFYQGQPLLLPGNTRTGSFKTGEHAYAAMKFYGTDAKHFKAICDADDPNEAKALGRSRQHHIRPDWEMIKYDVMAGVVRAKFTPHRTEGLLLLGTGDKLLVEGTYWGDDVWGVDLNTRGRPGRNWLGTLLMARRAELKAYATSQIEEYDVAKFVDETAYHNIEFGRGN